MWLVLVRWDKLKSIHNPTRSQRDTELSFEVVHYIICCVFQLLRLEYVRNSTLEVNILRWRQWEPISHQKFDALLLRKKAVNYPSSMCIFYKKVWMKCKRVRERTERYRKKREEGRKERNERNSEKWNKQREIKSEKILRYRRKKNRDVFTFSITFWEKEEKNSFLTCITEKENSK